MAHTSSFFALIHSLDAGDSDQAAEAIVHRFGSRLAALAAAKMSERLKQRLGPEDIVQSVFATFFRRIDEKELEIRDWDSLWGLLAQIVVWRICRHVERHRAARRDQKRETAAVEGVQMLARDPSPEEAALVSDLCAKLLEGMDEKYRYIVEMILEGVTHERIAQETRTSLSTVERVHRRAKDRLRNLLAEAGPSERAD